MTKYPVVNKWLDLVDRVGWTGIQTAAAALVLYLTGEGVLTWAGAGIIVGVSMLTAVAKVMAGQRTGPDDMGSLIGTPVIEPIEVPK
jgi:hypothetical protein